jgi:hypothetical protein
MTRRSAQRPPWAALSAGLGAITAGLLGFPHWFAILTLTIGLITIGRYVDGALLYLKDRP